MSKVIESRVKGCVRRIKTGEERDHLQILCDLYNGVIVSEFQNEATLDETAAASVLLEQDIVAIICGVLLNESVENMKNSGEAIEKVVQVLRHFVVVIIHTGQWSSLKNLDISAVLFHVADRFSKVPVTLECLRTLDIICELSSPFARLVSKNSHLEWYLNSSVDSIRRGILRIMSSVLNVAGNTAAINLGEKERHIIPLMVACVSPHNAALSDESLQCLITMAKLLEHNAKAMLETDILDRVTSLRGSDAPAGVGIFDAWLDTRHIPIKPTSLLQKQKRREQEQSGDEGSRLVLSPRAGVVERGKTVRQAALLIQAQVRGHLARKAYKEAYMRKKAEVAFQSAFQERHGRIKSLEDDYEQLKRVPAAKFTDLPPTVSTDEASEDDVATLLGLKTGGSTSLAAKPVQLQQDSDRGRLVTARPQRMEREPRVFEASRYVTAEGDVLPAFIALRRKASDKMAQKQQRRRESEQGRVKRAELRRAVTVLLDQCHKLDKEAHTAYQWESEALKAAEARHLSKLQEHSGTGIPWWRLLSADD